VTLIEVIGFVAASLTAGCWFPQALRTLRTRDTAAISLMAQSMFALGVALWAIYGVMIMSWPIIICNIVTLVPVLAIVALKLRDGLNRGPD
jgi:MtN3 and saliva related transmembrane protein